MGDKAVYRGEMYYAELEEKCGSEQFGHRPVVILQNNIGNKYSGTIIIAPITSKIGEKSKLPTHIKIREVSGLRQDSMVLLEQITVIDKSRLKDYIGLLSSSDMTKINDGIIIALGLGSVERGLTTGQAILYAQLALHNLQKSANYLTPENLKMFMKSAFQLYPVIEEAEKVANKLFNAKNQE